MNTRELIKQLQENDPTGDSEVCVSNRSVIFVEGLPAYYDGRLHKNVYANGKLEKIIITTRGTKVLLSTYPTEDALFDNPDFKVELDVPEYDTERWGKWIEKQRERGREFKVWSNKWKENQAFDDYCKLLYQLHELIADGRGDEADAEAIRDKMDKPGREMSEEQVKKARQLSAELYKKREDKMESKYGYHPCDRETFLKLKELKKHYYETQRNLFTWFRWDRKQEQNRVGPEPKYHPLFVKNEYWQTKSQRRDPVTGSLYSHIKYYNRKLDDQGILELYEKARMPSPEPVEPFDEATLKLIDSLHSQR